MAKDKRCIVREFIIISGNSEKETRFKARVPRDFDRKVDQNIRCRRYRVVIGRKRSIRLNLPIENIETSLLKIHLMRWRGYDFPSPAEIVGGTTLREISQTVRDEHRKVLNASIGK